MCVNIVLRALSGVSMDPGYVRNSPNHCSYQELLNRFDKIYKLLITNGVKVLDNIMDLEIHQART